MLSIDWFSVIIIVSMTTKHYHFIGIGGIGISAIARYYKNLGYTISGSNESESDLIDLLRNEGMDISIGHSEAHISSDIDTIVYTKAVLGTANSLEEGYKNNTELME
jgi:UDP-N-acetylmuramate--alanine ligase